jgi:hypothetical protein
MKLNLDPTEPGSMTLAIVLTVLVAMGVPYVIIWSLNALGSNIQFNFWSSVAVWALLVMSNIGIGISRNNNQQ